MQASNDISLTESGTQPEPCKNRSNICGLDVSLEAAAIAVTFAHAAEARFPVQNKYSQQVVTFDWVKTKRTQCRLLRL
jgi:hypothetical protein